MELLGLIDVPLYVVLVVVIVSLLYIYGKWRFTLLEDNGIRGPKPTIFIGNMGTVFKKGFVKALTDWKKEYGKVFGIYFGKRPTVVVSDLDILKEVLVKNFQNFTNRALPNTFEYPVTKGVFFARNPDWRRIRNIITPTFSSGKLKMMCGKVNHCANTLSNNFAGAAKRSDIVDVKEYFGAYTMDAIALTAFGILVDSQHDFSNPLVQNIVKWFSTLRKRSILGTIASMAPHLAPVVVGIRKLFFPLVNQHYITDAVEQMIKQRRRDMPMNNDKKVDFLQLLLNAENETMEEEDQEQNGHEGDEQTWDKKLSTDEVIGQAFLFLIAGYETTATTLQYASYRLATHPECQEKAFEEIENELGKGEPDYGNISKLKYLDCVFYETLRMYPPVAGVNREVAETVTIKGVTLPKGAAVHVPIFQIQRSAENYPDPDEFKPERFASKAEMNPLKFLPFGYGPRLCIGMRLALMEAKIAMVHVLRKVKFVRLADTPDEIDFGNNNATTPVTPITLGVEPRKVVA